MSRLAIVTSNRLERLVDLVATRFADDPLPPLEQEIVVVQSQGLRRWLALELARRRGIAASFTTPFPRPLARWLARRVLDGDELPVSEPVPSDEDSLFGRELLTWRIFAELGRALRRRAEEPAFQSPLAYLADDGDQRKRYQLAVRLGRLFDEYQVFRPDLLRRFEAGDDASLETEIEEAGDAERWQGALWRRLVATREEEPLHRRMERLVALLERAEVAPAGLPHRLTVLGVSSLPPAFLDLLAAISRFVPVLVAFTSPTWHYWADLRSERETARLARRLRLDGEHLDEQHFDEGHPLLAALGRQGRDFFRLLQDLDPTGSAWHEVAFEDPAAASPAAEDDASTVPALAILQSDILHLRRRAGDERIRLDPAAAPDPSLEIHACHSPMREMEVLRDRLLDAFATLGGLRPGDVLVMVPDIELYGPYVQAVFGVERPGVPTIPFAIADRRAGRERPPAETFLQVLELLGARLTVREVFDLLDTPAVRRRFGLAADDLPTLRRFCESTRIRWALDGEHKRRFDVPPDDAHTWRRGLDRLLLGYATGDGTDTETGHGLVEGLAPHAGDTAGTHEILGRFALAIDTLGTELRRLEAPRAPERWANDLAATVDALFAAEDEAEERGLQLVRDAIHRLADAQRRADIDGPVGPRVALEHLSRALDAEGFGGGFVDGRVTFCRLEPMRSVPFRVIAVAGLDDGAFPRRDREIGFDLIGRDPRPGDRTPREDDRYLFLETLLAARDRLHLSYVGRSQKDASEREPSVVLAELLDQLDRTFVVEESGPARERFVVEHWLQPWSPSYFTDATRDPRLRSRSTADAGAAVALTAPARPVPPFFDPAAHPASPDPEPGPDLDLEPDLEMDLDELARFWLLPCRAFLEALQIRLGDPDADAILPDAEPFRLESLAAYRLRQVLTERRLHARALGESIDHAAERRLLLARGELPAAGLGEAEYHRLARRVETFVERVPTGFSRLPPRDVRVAGEGFRLAGTLAAVGENERLRFRCARLGPHDLLRAWIEHVALARADIEAGARPRRRTRIVAEDRTVTLRPPDDPAARLAALVDGLRRGRLRPLPIFPRASHAYTEQAHQQRDPRSRARIAPLDKAREAFHGRGGRDERDLVEDGVPADADDPYVRLAFRGVDPLDDLDFGPLAERLWRPIFEHLREEAR